MPTAMPEAVVTETKPWHESRTLRFNMAVSALVALEENFHVLQPLLPVDVYAVVSVVLIVGNAVLRVITNKQLTLN